MMNLKLISRLTSVPILSFKILPANHPYLNAWVFFCETCQKDSQIHGSVKIATEQASAHEIKWHISKGINEA